jgi:hypothetical protein
MSGCCSTGQELSLRLEAIRRFAIGATFETLSAHGLLALLGREVTRPPVYNWRSGGRDEVDFVIELASDLNLWLLNLTALKYSQQPPSNMVQPSPLC